MIMTAKKLVTTDGRIIFDESTVIEWDPADGDCPICQRAECGGHRTCASIGAENGAWLKAINLDPDNPQWVAECLDVANLLATAFDARIDAGAQRAKIRILEKGE